MNGETDKSRFFKKLHGEVKNTCNMLMYVAVLWGIFSLVGVLTTLRMGFDGFREYLTLYFVYIAAGSFGSAMLLSRGRRAGLVLAWMVLPLIIIFVPIGTYIGLKAAPSLRTEEMKSFVSK